MTRRKLLSISRGSLPELQIRRITFTGKRRPYRASICVNGVKVNLGTFWTEGQAAIDVAEVMNEWYGEDMWWPYIEPATEHYLYPTWANIIQRCRNKNNNHYKDYGGRGIRVCCRWEKSFYAFIVDMGDRPTEKHSIDRINVNGGYHPENCRWATQTTQMRNTRYQLKVGNGVSFKKIQKKWAAYITHNGKQIGLGYYKKKSDAIAARKNGEEKYWNHL